jgi:hypothetical protein
VPLSQWPSMRLWGHSLTLLSQWPSMCLWGRSLMLLSPLEHKQMSQGRCVPGVPRVERVAWVWHGAWVTLTCYAVAAVPVVQASTATGQRPPLSPLPALASMRVAPSHVKLALGGEAEAGQAPRLAADMKEEVQPPPALGRGARRRGIACTTFFSRAAPVVTGLLH